MSTISASTLITTALQYTADTTGTLVFKTGATPTTALTLNADQSATFAGTVNFAIAGFTDLSYTGTLTGGTGIVNIGSGQFYKDASGNIGVGTTTPRYQTSGATAGATTLTVYNALAGGGGVELATNTTTPTGLAGRLTFAAAQNASGSRTIAYIDSLVQGSTSANQGGLLRFATKPDNGTVAVAMTISSVGYVGIGVTSPACALHVAGTIQAQSGSTYSQKFADGGAAYLSSAGAYPLILQTNSANRMIIGSDGKVGIATSGQAYQFSVFGGASRFTEMNGDTFRVRLASSEGGWSMRYAFSANDGTELGSMTAGGTSQAITAIAWNMNSSEKMRLTSAGNLGIGTDSPSYPFVVASANESASTLIGTYNSNVGAGSAGLQFLLYHTGADVTLGNYRSGALIFTTNNANRMYIGSNGFVGIGTTTPQKKLAVSNAGVNGIETSPDDAAVGTNRILSYNRSTAAYTPLTIQGSELRFFTNGINATESMRLDASGNLLVNGTTNPLGGKVYANGRLAARGLYIPLTPAAGAGTAENFGEAYYTGQFVMNPSTSITLWDNMAYYGTQFFEVFIQVDPGGRFTQWFRGQCSGYGGSYTVMEVSNGQVCTMSFSAGTPATGQCRVTLNMGAIPNAASTQVWLKIHGTAASTAYVTSSYLGLN